MPLLIVLLGGMTLERTKPKDGSQLSMGGERLIITNFRRENGSLGLDHRIWLAGMLQLVRTRF